LTPAQLDRVVAGLPGLKERAKTMVELADSALIYVKDRPIVFDDKAQKILAEGGRPIMAQLVPSMASVSAWSRDALETLSREFAETNGHKLGAVAQPLRAAITGSTVSPPIFEVMEILGRDEALGRLQDAISGS